MWEGRVLIYGGKGALGSTILNFFKAEKFWVMSVDLKENDQADANVVVHPSQTWVEQESAVLDSVKSILKDDKLDGVFCVAGGWAGGNATSPDMIKNAELMWRQSVWSSAISARIAAAHLKEKGLLQLTGAAPALEGTPGMMGYGMAKAAVQQLTKSCAAKDSGMPNGAISFAICPVTLDTPMNRKWMPDADFNTWTSMDYIATLLHGWVTNDVGRPTNGALMKFVTYNTYTSINEF